MDQLSLWQEYITAAVLDLLDCRNEQRTGRALAIPGVLNFSWGRMEEIVRIFSILENILHLAQDGCEMSLRALYYRSASLFTSQSQCNQYLNDILRHARIGSREECRIFAAAKGLFFDPTTLAEHLIDGGLIEKLPSLVHGSLRAVLVIEKHSVFSMVVKSEVVMHQGIGVVTGKGFPDLTTKRFLCRLAEIADIPFLYLGDFDPHGLHIYLNYQRGSSAEATNAVPQLRYVGLRSADLDLLESAGQRSQLMPLNARDVSLLQGLSSECGSQFPRTAKSRRVARPHPLSEEVRAMLRVGVKCEVEALSAIAKEYLCSIYLVRAIKACGVLGKK